MKIKGLDITTADPWEIAVIEKMPRRGPDNPNRARNRDRRKNERRKGESRRKH